jgi:glycosyltransferase involved in cell wall biosynthesis
MRIAFVVQRYGLDVHGGAEMECRLWAERLAPRHDVAVLTTRARDYLTWADYYPAGVEMINGVAVHRFGVDAPRDLAAFDEYTHKIYGGSHTDAEEEEWMRQQGPYSTQLFDAIVAREDDFDLFVFITYLYCTSYIGLQLVPHKAVLVPTAHDEPPLYLRMFRKLFSAPRYVIYNTDAERALLHRVFDMAHIAGSEVAVGVDVEPHAVAEEPNAPPTLLYIGRVHGSKGCDRLYEHFVRYRAERTTDVRLLFAGRLDMDLPERSDIEYLGFVSEEEKRHLLHRCSLLVLPSEYESLSIVCLEAWAAGKATLVNGVAPVLREQSLRSNGGLFYTSYDEFAACLDLLLADPALRARLGRQGRRFVQRTYAWPVMERRLETALTHALEHIATTEARP